MRIYKYYINNKIKDKNETNVFKKKVNKSIKKENKRKKIHAIEAFKHTLGIPLWFVVLRHVKG